MQDPVDAKTHQPHVAPWFDVDIAGALLEGVLPQPVDDIDDVAVVGVVLAIALAKLHQLLEGRLAAAAVAAAALGRLFHRAGQVVELHQIPRHIGRVGHHAADFLLQDSRDFLLPLAHEGLGRCHHHFTQPHLHRQHAKARRVSRRHHRGHRREIDFQRIDAQVIQPHLPGQPFREFLQAQHPLGRALRNPFLVGENNQRMDVSRLLALGDEQGLPIGMLDHAVGDQQIDDFGETKAVFGHGRSRFLGHGQGRETGNQPTTIAAFRLPVPEICTALLAWPHQARRPRS